MAKANYGNWIRLRIIVIFLAVGAALAALGLLPAPDIARGGLWLAAAFPLGMGLYLCYVYGQLAAWGGGYQDKLWGLVVERLDWDGRGRALDIGTGGGALAIRLAKKYPEAHVTGIDFWGSSWEYGQSMCEKNARIEGVERRVSFQRASAAKLPFADASFDAAVSHFVFHEVADAPDQRDVIKEALRVLRPGGVFVFQDMFLNEKLYGSPGDLLAAVRAWDVTQVEFIETSRVLPIPVLLRSPRVLGYASLLVGKK